MKANKALKPNDDYLMAVYFILTVLVILLVLLNIGCASSGKDGSAGAAGAPGNSPTVQINPASPAECVYGGYDIIVNNQNEGTLCNGAPGSSGEIGPVGPQGPTGNSGQNGTNGTDGTIITIVQFCPGNTTYPSEFNEIGFCIDGNVYATYSTNGGFSAMIPPGIYSSDGVNASCTFTVSANCVITN